MNKRAPATGSERQAKYRALKGLGEVFLPEATRTAINSLQLRMGLRKGDVVARAIDMLTKEVDRRELRKKRPAAGRHSARVVAADETRAASSLGDKTAFTAVARAGTAQTPPADAQSVRGRSKAVRKAKLQDDSPDLFGGLIPRS